MPYTFDQVYGAISQWWFFGIGLVILLILSEVEPKIGGYLLIVIVLGLVYNAREKGYL